MKVLVLTASYVPVLGGLQAVAHSLARYLIARGHEVRVVTKRYPRSLASEEVIDLVPIQRWLFLKPSREVLRRKRPDLFAASLYHAPATLIRLARVLATFQPRTVNLHFPDSQIAPILCLRRFFSFRLVVSLHGHEVERHFGSDARSVVPDLCEDLKRVLRSADAVTACSRYLLGRAALIEPSVAAKGLVIHNGIDLEQLAGEGGYSHPRPYLLAYGRLTYTKGFDMLLFAFADIARRYNDLDLIIAGDGEEATALSKLSDDLELRARVKFYGRASSADVGKLLRGCRAVVVPSRQETFGIVALEAIACGRPLVATRVGGLPELAEAAPGASITFAEPEPADLSRAVTHALSIRPADPRDLDAFSLQRMVSAYERVLEPRRETAHGNAQS